MSFNLSLLSKYRTELMGISALLILICHSVAYISMPNFMKYTLSLGNIGVDLFLFISGMGLWYSLEKFNSNNRESVWGGILYWYKDRYKKLFVPYLLTIFVSVILQYCFGTIHFNGLIDFILYISTLRFYTSHSAPWFIAAIIPLYLFAPLFFYLLKRNVWLFASVLIILFYAIHLCPLSLFPKSLGDIWSNIQFVSIRAICFVLGMSMGQFVKFSKTIPIWLLIVVLVLGIVIIYFTKHLVYGYFFLTLPLLCMLSFLMESSCDIMRKVMSFMGKISLESYIFNGAIPGIVISLFTMSNLSVFNNTLPYLLACVIGIVLSYIFYLISKRILKN